jgi:hypothetical protein
MAYYHFVREHESLRVADGETKGKKVQKEYPAMAAGVTERHWSVMELISASLP